MIFGNSLLFQIAVNAARRHAKSERYSEFCDEWDAAFNAEWDAEVLRQQLYRDNSLLGLSAYHDRITGDILILGEFNG